MKALLTLLGIGGGVLVLIFGISFLVGSLCWPYTINTWLVFTGRPAAIEWWMGGLIGLVPLFGQFSIPAAIGTFILMLFLG